ncbi:hypothetical protein VQ056_02795 [Paenibacillus sp. JTLBN-2024]|uniref:Helix-turn-helix conjugative transposon-like domain-containing protein n=1 Tax=Paenibacillus cookii TaxID=157839 RepID=A0ABQ4M122_9BACL|nr:hypothetical protein [Paenibacillus cookii]KHF36531.1 hypothetical protein CM49_01187 [Paenibacillus sp. P1XP2]GIO69231.1 hypothetical protein J21TS3_40520 [Paenibacillus cookii]HWO53671.1 hypothetical protein [Paenibacillus cookii]
MQDLQLPQIVSDILAGDPAKYELIMRKYQRAIREAVLFALVTDKRIYMIIIKEVHLDLGNHFEPWIREER